MRWTKACYEVLLWRTQPLSPYSSRKPHRKRRPPPSKEEEAWQQALIQSDPSRNYLIKQWRNRSPVTFICYSKPITGQIRSIRKYDLFLHDRTKAVDKAEILYLYKPDVAPSVQKAVRIDPDVAKEKLRSLRKKSLRLEIPEATLVKCFEEQRVITVTMRNGHVLVGTIHSYGVFSVRLTIAPETRVILMRHSIYDLAFDRRTHQGIQTATTSSRSK